ncbi:MULTISPECIES: RsmB/NOP family class I SAM-dependent RNA methyltransferase [unclassified Corynebacterium]|uniref:RsmB/NOP family class I SAM-dependent RNA methyltransferase n=1 Tax=unclassified Corynebacterium TaxID=2624378 RepID=UPI00265367E7|nr:MULTISPECIES: transcription antitermination factor NusB [unclassified Corynebacterium]MDN8593911.1 transcription antitermination factor NusB [Corynebacterium sp. P4_F2]WKK56012.1 transcription antitermination factor NusB [Corynebacterium sp. P4-C1]
MSGGFRSRTKRAKEQAEQEALHGPKKRAPQRDGATRHQPSSSSPDIGDVARQAAFDAVLRVETEDAFGNLVLPQILRERRITGRDAAFATEIAYGTLRTMGVLDTVVAECSSRPLADLDPAVLTALRLGAYQVLFTRVDDHAAVDTSVRLAEAAGAGKAKGFVNGILRTITRTTPREWMEMLAPEGEIAATAFRTAHPEWIARSFAAVVGEDELEAALEADSQRPIVHLVARPGEMSAEELALVTGGEEGRYSPYAVYLAEGGDPGSLEPVREKMAAVQDEGSQLIARAVAELAVTDDAGRWLDLCAGPGGKAALMGSLASIDGAAVDAVEITPTRADLIRKSTEGLPVTVHVADGRDSGLEPGYDRVLVDAPCSGLGALRRRPEARWRKSEADIAELTGLQSELLASAVKLAKPGGVIVYSTCSPDERETRRIVDKQLAQGDVEEIDVRGVLPQMGDLGPHLSAQMWPHRHGTDAMFLAALRKR